MTFTEWLQFEMSQRGWNRADLADNSGVTRGAISHIFSGSRQPGLEMLRGIARSLQLPSEQVFRAAGLFEDTPGQIAGPPQPPGLGEWIHLFMDADEDTREVMLDNARFFSQRKLGRHHSDRHQ